MIDQDTLRWGDSYSLQFTTVAGLLPTAAFTGGNPRNRQLVMAEWRWPLLWGLRFVIVPAFVAAENATFTLTFAVTIGCGQATCTAKFPYTLAPTAGVYAPINDLQPMPGQNIQVAIDSFTGTSGAPVGTQESLLVGAFVSPYTEPHAMTRMFDSMGPSPAELERQEHRWMPQSAQVPGAELVRSGPPNFQPPRYGR